MARQKPEQKEQAGSIKSLKELGLESYEMVEIHRSQLNKAPYNPRKITDNAKRKLKKSLAKLGLVAPITWNVRTGNIVGGHQRITILDSITGTPDYTLNVAKIDVDEKREKEINIALNNQDAMGETDLEAAQAIINSEGFDIEAAGYDQSDVLRIFGNNVEKIENVEAMQDIATHMEKMKSMLQSSTESQAGKVGGIDSDWHFYQCFVFKNQTECDNFIEKLGLPYENFQSGQWLADRLGIDISVKE